MIASDVGSEALDMVEGYKESSKKYGKGFVIPSRELMETQGGKFYIIKPDQFQRHLKNHHGGLKPYL
jgi:hypothetical protein